MRKLKIIEHFSLDGVIQVRTPPRSLELVGTQAMPSGIILSTYRAAGPLKTG